jgi:hypothetical protein
VDSAQCKTSLALNRITFGARVEERARFAEIGLQAYIEEQLDFESINDLACDLQLSNFETLKMEANEIEGITNQLFDGYDRERPATNYVKQLSCVSCIASVNSTK